MSVLISGIGIAGPTLAYWLSAHGLEPTLIERAPRLRTGGYVIDFWGGGFDVAERMGLLPDIRRDGYDIKELRLVNARGRRIGGFNVDVFRAAANGRYVSIPRGDLAKSIYQKIEGRCETIFGDSIKEIKQNGAGVDVNFEHGPLANNLPAGGNLVMTDGHVEWRTFTNMAPRTGGEIPVFWW